MKHERATFQKVKNKKFVKTWKKAIVQRVLGTTTYQVQYVFSDGSLGNLSIVHRNRIKACHTREEDLWTDVQCQQERREQGERLERVLKGAHSLLLQDVRVDYDDPVIRRRLIYEFWMVLMLEKFHVRLDRRLKDKFLDEL